MNNWVITFGIAIFTGIIGSIVGGLAYDAMWMGSEGFLPECNKLQEGWQEVCNETYQNYYSGKNLIHFAGFLVPCGIFIAILKKLVFD